MFSLFLDIVISIYLCLRLDLRGVLNNQLTDIEIYEYLQMFMEDMTIQQMIGNSNIYSAFTGKRRKTIQSRSRMH